MYATSTTAAAAASGASGVTLASLVDLVDERLGGFDASTCTGAQAMSVVAATTAMIRRCEAVRLAALGRVEETGVWSEAGARSVGAFVASSLDVPFGRAGDLVDAAVAMRSQPDTARLAASGAVGQDRLVLAAATVAARPDAAAEICAAAGSMDRNTFRASCRRWRQEHEDADARLTRHRNERHMRITVDDDGRVELNGAGPADDGVEFQSLFKPWVDQVMRIAREDGDQLTGNQARWDALLSMARWAANPDSTAYPDHDGDGDSGADGDTDAGDGARKRRKRGRKRGRPASLRSGQGSRVKTIIRVDLPALLRSAAMPGELCDQPGLGDIDVATARRLIADGAFVSLIFTNGVDDTGEPVVTDIAHLGRTNAQGDLSPPDPDPPADADATGHDPTRRRDGTRAFLSALFGRAAGRVEAVDELVHDGRHPNAAQRSVLEFRYPTCSVPGCTMTEGLEADHIDRYCETHETRLRDLDRKCRPHHRAKTTAENVADGRTSTGRRPGIRGRQDRTGSAPPGHGNHDGGGHDPPHSQAA